jgi:ureidoglycolate hydrolase
LGDSPEGKAGQQECDGQQGVFFGKNVPHESLVLVAKGKWL